MEYKASLDSLAKGVTIGAIVLFTAITLIMINPKVLGLSSVFQDYNNAPFVQAGIIAFYVTLILFCYLYAPKSYTLSNDALIINRPASNKTIALSDIEQVRAVDASELRGTVRTFGNSGLFGFYGKYYNSILGKMTWYATKRQNRILITTKDSKKIIITPDDMSLLTALQSKQQSRMEN